MALLLTQGRFEGIFQLIVVLIIFVVVLVLTYYTTKWIAGYQKKHGNGKNFRIVESAKIATNKYIEIVEAGKEHYFVIAIGKDEVTFIGELPKEDVFLEEEGVNAQNGFMASAKSSARFSELLSSFKKRK
ncbi:MAG: flagellar biosynthetic protein FliO [Lachnospiraceae bacterium]|jgi:flagellar protein FliO/FliZ|nr:flagellar biosynthetic protein FliO [Lachnospiraceae bacterium]MBQ6258229.1 flagellar biosynthetic protein FliO [Lachnospiraceae bacterium]